MPTLAFAGFTLDPLRRTLTAGDEPVRLQGKPFDLLLYLVTERDRPVDKDELYARVWGGNAVEESNLRVQMSNLRRALAAHGADDLIITVPGRGYRFVGAATEIPIETAAAAGGAPVAVETAKIVAPAAHSRTPIRRIALAVVGLAVAALTWRGLVMAPALPARVRLETVPDEISIAPGGLRPVDYEISVLDPVDLQLETEDWQFYLVNGQPVGPAMVGGRIYRGSFTIRGSSVGTYHNNLYLIPEVAEAARRAGETAVQLRHVFHLRDSAGREVRVPAVVLIHIAGLSKWRDPFPGAEPTAPTH